MTGRTQLRSTREDRTINRIVLAAARLPWSFGESNMTNVVDHPRPCMPSPPEAAQMTVSLASFGMPDRYERLIIVPSPTGDYVVACLPFFSYGIQFGDFVTIQQPGNVFERVLKSSGLRTLRFAFTSPSIADEHHEQLHGKVVASGLPHEWHGSGYVAVLLRHLQDQEIALNCLASAIESGEGCWEVDPKPYS